MTRKSPAAPTPPHATANIRQEVHRLAEAMVHGRLDERADESLFIGADAELAILVNRMLDSLVSPLRLAAGAIDEVAHGRIPPFIIDDYPGEFNEIKLNINTLLATLFGLHSETQHLIAGISQGKLRTRGNDWDFGGIWRDLIGGVNGTLDAVIDPVNEASTILGRLARYDLSARMHGKYRGDHATIKKAMNVTAESLHDAVSQVAETVDLVSTVGQKITHSSQIVAEGAATQEQQLNESSANLACISESSVKSAQNTSDAQRLAQNAVTSIATAKTAMDQMLEAMEQICNSADNTAGIIQEIDAIAKETEILAASAAAKALRVRSSAGGFGVVANQIRNLSTICEESVDKLRQFHQILLRGTDAGTNSAADERMVNDFEFLIADLNRVATTSGLLGVNAAIEAAHVEGAGNDFEILTEEIRMLAQRSTDAAKRSDQLIRGSVELARQGKELSQRIDEDLQGAVEGATTISRITDEISQASHDQASGLEQLSRSVFEIKDVTHKNAASAMASTDAAHDLARQVTKLATMVSKFRLEEATTGAGG